MKKLFTYFFIIAISYSGLLGNIETNGKESELSLLESTKQDVQIVQEKSWKDRIRSILPFQNKKKQIDPYDEAKEEFIDYYKRLLKAQWNLINSTINTKNEINDITVIQKFFNEINPKNLKEETKQLIINFIAKVIYHNYSPFYVIENGPYSEYLLEEILGSKYAEKCMEMIYSSMDYPDIDPTEELESYDIKGLFFNHFKNLDHESFDVALKIKDEIEELQKTITNKLETEIESLINKRAKETVEDKINSLTLDYFLLKHLIKTARNYSPENLYQIIFENDEKAKELRLKYLNNLLDNIKRNKSLYIQKLTLEIATFQMANHYFDYPSEIKEMDSFELLAFEILSMSKKAKGKDFDIDNVIKYKKATDSIFAD